MCGSFAEKDEQIKVVHKENCGASTVRNRGLDICSGEYVAFEETKKLYLDNGL